LVRANEGYVVEADRDISHNPVILSEAKDLGILLALRNTLPGLEPRPDCSRISGHVLDLVIDILHDPLHRFGKRFAAAGTLKHMHSFGNLFSSEATAAKASESGSLICLGSVITTLLPSRRMMCPGTPTQWNRRARLRSTTDPAPIRELRPTVMLPRIFAPPPTTTLSRRVDAACVLLAGSAERHALIERDILADNGRLANHHAHAVIDEKPAANLRSRMDFDAVSKRATCDNQRASRKKLWFHNQ